MPKGTPLWPYCRRCRKGYNPSNVFDDRGRNTKKTGFNEERVTKSRHGGFGSGGQSFFGHRGEMECLDCGAKWFSTHPSSGAAYASDVRDGKVVVKFKPKPL